MRNWCIAALLAAGLGVLAAPFSGAQEKKAEPKKEQPKKEQPKKIKEADPAKIDDPDFKIQGEYVGEHSGKAIGAQVVALGNGKFDVRLLAGGLPGAGWDNKTQQKGAGKTENGQVLIEGKEFTGTIASGTLTFKVKDDSATLKRIERKSDTLGKKPPEGAIVLFGGPEDASKWNGGKVVKLSDGEFLGVEARSKQAFKSYKLHLEFRLAYQPNDRGQGRSNSGVYFQNCYECQVLDSFGLKGENNECGGLYTLKTPDVNMCLPPMQWQTYDAEFTAAEFADGKKTKAARLTMYHNGVKIHDNVELAKPTDGRKEKEEPGYILLQNHGDPLVYRNIWLVEQK